MDHAAQPAVQVLSNIVGVFEESTVTEAPVQVIVSSLFPRREGNTDNRTWSGGA